MKKFSAEEKKKAVRQHFEKDRTIDILAKEYDVTKATMRRWLRGYCLECRKSAEAKAELEKMLEKRNLQRNLFNLLRKITYIKEGYHCVPHYFSYNYISIAIVRKSINKLFPLPSNISIKHFSFIAAMSCCPIAGAIRIKVVDLFFKNLEQYIQNDYYLLPIQDHTYFDKNLFPMGVFNMSLLMKYLQLENEEPPTGVKN